MCGDPNRNRKYIICVKNFFEDLVQIHAIIILSSALNNLTCELKIVEDLLSK